MVLPCLGWPLAPAPHIGAAHALIEPLRRDQDGADAVLHCAPVLPHGRRFPLLSLCFSMGKGIKRSPGFCLISFAVDSISKRGIKLQLSGHEGIVCSLFMLSI